MTGHWAEIARRWQQVGPPLRPSVQDIAFYTRAIADITAPRALILGVTPELYHLPWPAGANGRAEAGAAEEGQAGQGSDG